MASTPASVGVTTPPTMPHRMITGASSDSMPSSAVRPTRRERERHRRRAWLTPAGDAVVDERHQHQTDQNAWQQAGDEDLGDRDLRGNGVDHHHDAGRNDWPDGRGGQRHRGSEFGPVAGGLHRTQLHRAQPGRIGHRRARDAREDHAGQHVHLRQATAHEADHSGCEVEYLLRDPQPIHQIGGQDEERHRHQWNALGACGHYLWNAAQVVATGQHADDGRQGDGDRNR